MVRYLGTTAYDDAKAQEIISQPGYSGPAPTIEPPKPVVYADSAQARAGEQAMRTELDQLGTTVATQLPQEEQDAIRKQGEDERALVDRQRSDLARQKEAEIASINTAFGRAREDLGNQQGREMAGRSTSLITTAGGYLGNTESHSGVLQNLSNEHGKQQQALEEKKANALRMANQAYADRDYDLARDMIEVTRKTQDEINKRTEKFVDTQIKLRDQIMQQTKMELDQYNADRNYDFQIAKANIDNAFRNEEFTYKQKQDAFDNELKNKQLDYQQKQDLIENAFKGQQITETVRHNKMMEVNAARQLQLQAQRLEFEASMATDPSNLMEYAEQYAATGKMPAGLPKGAFGMVAEAAKDLPKQNGQIVSTVTGVPNGNIPAAEQEDFQRLYNIVGMMKELKTADQERWHGAIGGTLGKITGSNVQGEYLILRQAIVDEISRMQTGAALTKEEQAFYKDYIPGRISEVAGFGRDPSDKIDDFDNLMNRKLTDKLGNRGLSIYGYRQVEIDGELRTVGSVHRLADGHEGRVNSDGSVTLIK